MPNPIDFPESNFTFTAPASQPEVRDLKAHIDQAGITSCWQFTDEELEIIQTTKRIWVNVVGHGLPPMSIQTSIPFQPEVDFPESIDPD